MERNKLELGDFYHENEGDTIWWTERGEYIDGVWDYIIGEWLFSFDKKKIYSFFVDYPYNMTEEEIEIFNRENPHLANYFKGRFKDMARGTENR